MLRLWKASVFIIKPCILDAFTSLLFHWARCSWGWMMLRRKWHWLSTFVIQEYFKMFLFILIFPFQAFKKNRRKILRSSSWGCWNQNMPGKKCPYFLANLCQDIGRTGWTACSKLSFATLWPPRAWGIECLGFLPGWLSNRPTSSSFNM